MRILLRSWVFVLTLALASNVAVIRQCTAAHQAAGQGSVSHHDDHQLASHAAGPGDHHHVGQDDVAAPEGPAVADQHACTKCCSMCTFASALPAQMDAPAHFHAAASFPMTTDHCSVADIRVDPGIPKRIA
jgi:hypothetical protein